MGEPASVPAIPPAPPKGLRSFGGEDAAFFLSLLPGPRGSDGLPESVRFWKSRIETVEGERSFSVGVVYGLSGGGKSSFVKAGLLPQLDRRGSGRSWWKPARRSPRPGCWRSFAGRLLSFPATATWPTPSPWCATIGQSRRREKLLLVLDQFEQWLQGRPDRARRRADPGAAAVRRPARAGAAPGAGRFLDGHDPPPAGGRGAAGRGDERRGGRALRRPPCAQGAGGLRPLAGADSARRDRAWQRARQFLDQAVSGLTGPDGRIVPVRLSLFVEVVRDRPWTLQTLQALGGMEGIGVKFLEEAFDAPSAAAGPPDSIGPPRRPCSSCLLPAPGSVLRGAPRSGRELARRPGYADRPGDFADLLRVLDHDLRLITAVDVETLGGPGGRPPADRQPAEPPARRITSSLTTT